MASEAAAATTSHSEPTEYPLVAYYDSTVKTSLIKLAPTSSAAVSLLNWTRPLKLNRKEQHVIRQLAEDERQAAKLAAERAVKPEGGATTTTTEEDMKMHQSSSGDLFTASGAGRLVKEERDESLIGPGASGTVASTKRRGWGKQKKTKQVFIAADQSARQLRKEEHAPWLLEDGTSPGGERWLGRFEGSSNGVGDASGDSPYVIFRLNESGNFEIIPLHRVYRFTPRPAYEPMNPEEAEKVYERIQKSGGKEEVQRWLAKKRSRHRAAGAGASERAERGVMPMLPGNRGIRTVNGGSRSGAKEEDDGDVKPRLGAEGDFDEFEFEEDFADDEEGGNLNDEAMEEEELRELEEKIKKEMRAAGRAGDEAEAGDDEDERSRGADEAKQQLTKEGKATKKLLRRKAKDDEYTSDEEEGNPYASEEDDDSDSSQLSAEEPKRMTHGSRPASGHPSLSVSRAGTPSLPRLPSAARLAGTPQGSSRSRANSPGPHAHRPGHALVAQRATSPRPGMDRDRRSERDKRAGGGGSRGTSPAPATMTPSKTAAAGKRKYAGDGPAGSQPGHKRVAAGVASNSSGSTPATPSASAMASAGTGIITEDEVVHFLRGRGMVATSELLKHFRRRLKDERNKGVIRALVTKVGMMSGGNVGLKAEYQ